MSGGFLGQASDAVYGLMGCARPSQNDRDWDLKVAIHKIERDQLLIKANLGMGKWIKSTDMDPSTIIDGRVYRRGGDKPRIWHDLYDVMFPRHADEVEWFFPD